MGAFISSIFSIFSSNSSEPEITTNPPTTNLPTTNLPTTNLPTTISLISCKISLDNYLGRWKYDDNFFDIIKENNKYKYVDVEDEFQNGFQIKLNIECKGDIYEIIPFSGIDMKIVLKPSGKNLEIISAIKNGVEKISNPVVVVPHIIENFQPRVNKIKIGMYKANGEFVS